MAHCDVCCLRLSLNKDKTLPKHYGTPATSFFGGWAQRECSASGTLKYTPDRQFKRPCSRTRSRQSCPCCQSKGLKLNQNGKFQKHPSPDGGRCSLSDSNQPR